MVDRQAYGRIPADDPSYTVPISVEQVDGTTARVVACVWDTGILFGPGGGIFNDEKVSADSTFTLVRENEVWFVSAADATRREIGVNSCPART
jgi:hypothetical protein